MECFVVLICYEIFCSRTVYNIVTKTTAKQNLRLFVVYKFQLCHLIVCSTATPPFVIVILVKFDDVINISVFCFRNNICKCSNFAICETWIMFTFPKLRKTLNLVSIFIISFISLYRVILLVLMYVSQTFVRYGPVVIVILNIICFSLIVVAGSCFIL